MTHDARYTPPNADLVEISPPGPPAQRPMQVAWAVRLLWAGMGLVTLSGVILLYRGSATPQSPVGGRLVSALFLLVFVALYSGLIRRVDAGRNWARIAVLVLTISNLLLMMAPWETDYQTTLIEDLADIAGAACALLAVVLLYLPAASAWFRKRD